MKRLFLGASLVLAAFAYLVSAHTPPAQASTAATKAATARAVGTPAPKATRTGVEWKVEPAEVVILLDGKKLGTAKDLKFTATTPGKHTINLTNGGDEEEMEVKVVKGQVLQVVYSFGD